MTLFAQTGGQRQTAIASLLDTNEVDLIVSSSGGPSTLESINFCNTTGSSISVDCIFDKKGSSVYVCNAEPVAAHSRLHITDHNLTIDADCVLRVKGDAGIDVTAVHIRTHANRKGG